MSKIFLPTPENIARAAALLKEGKCVAFPTETVYGIGANATIDAAVAGIYETKERPQFNPLISHMRDAKMAMHYVEWNETAKALAKAFWPGPLTLVLKRKGRGATYEGRKVFIDPRPLTLDPAISLLATAGLDTAAVRSPAHPVAQALIEACGFPLAAPSANRSGRISPTTARHVEEELGDRLEMILDGGPCAVGIESTVVDCTGGDVVILRPGSVTAEDIMRVLSIPSPDGRGIGWGVQETKARSISTPTSILPQGGRKINSPGQLASHYAPSLPVRLNAREIQAGEALITFGKNVPEGAVKTVNISKSGNLKEAAANLFAALRELDRPEFSGIAVMPIPEEGVGMAINDRLKRAATR